MIADPSSVPRRLAPRARRRLVMVTVLLAVLWPVLASLAYGSTDALLGVGVQGPSRAAIDREIPHLRHVRDIGNDGQLFYVIARHPFAPQAAAPALDAPAYRYRRILFPLLAGSLAPAGGRALIAAFAVVSLVGVGLGAWALSGLDGAPAWLPVSLALTPVVIASLTLSLSDALATGLALGALLAVERRRWGLAVVALAAAVLTRETFLLVALGLACAPAMPRRWRLALVAVPGALLGTWSLWSAHLLRAPVLGGSAEQLAVPFTGWLSPHVQPQSLALGLMAGAILAGGAWRARRRSPHVAAVLALQLGLLACLSDLVAFSWIHSLRTAAPMLPLAFWSLRRPAAPATGTEGPRVVGGGRRYPSTADPQPMGAPT